MSEDIDRELHYADQEQSEEQLRDSLCEPEWCNSCSADEDVEYTFDYYLQNDVYYCSHCGRPL